MIQNRKGHVFSTMCAVAFLLCTNPGSSADLQIDASSFRCITKMTPVRQFYVDNLRGNLDATLAAANSTTGAVYPPGSVIQLIPGEAMVKQDKGFNAATHDWEFFELDVSKDGTQIRKRGTVDVVNRFGGECFGCHVPAAAQWDLVCETGHGCAPLEVTRAMTRALQRTDPRCDNPPITPEDAEALKQLEQLLKGEPDHIRRQSMPYDIKVNGAIRTVDVDGDTPLLWVLRDVLGMTGTKFGCGMALCGACTVHVGAVATRSCITPIDSIGTSEITTIEAIGATAAGAKIQKAWLDREVVQCGYCQSGQIMSASALLASNPQPTDSDIDDAMSGNICRCGTYVRIREAIKQAAQSSGQGG